MNERQVEFETLKIELDQKTEYAQHKKNKINKPIKALRVGLSSSPNVILYAKFKEGDEITLWPGRIVNLSEKSEGLSIRWEGQVNEWVELEISANAPFVSGDYRPLEFDSGSSAEKFRKTYFVLDDVTPIQILAPNEKRVFALIKNPTSNPVLIGNFDNLNPADGLRYQKTIKIMPFENKKVELTGELFIIGTVGTWEFSRIVVEEFLK